MRIGLLGDVHANLFALQASIARLRAEGVDAWVCAGDLVGYGPHPNECVETLAELAPTCVAGNHELMALGELSGARAGRLARQSIAWTREVLRPDVREYLSALPRAVAQRETLLAHGSPGDPEEYVRSAARADELLGGLDDGQRLLLLGHTHRPWLYGTAAGGVFPTPGRTAGEGSFPLSAGQRYLINPGAVGQSREREPAPRARFALIDLDAARVHYFAQPYDDEATRAALRERRLPADAVHVRPGRVAGATRKARRLYGLAADGLRRDPRGHARLTR